MDVELLNDTKLALHDFEIKETSASASNNLEVFVPQWIVICYYVIVFTSACVSLATVVTLARNKRNGILSSILQLSIVDVCTSYVAVLEVWTLNKHTWNFSTEMCPLFLGSEILCNTLAFYLIICLCFHIISLWNINVQKMQTYGTNPLTFSGGDASEECLVTKTDNSKPNRTVTIDYSKKKFEVSIIFPSMLVWFICLSLSIPQYSLSSTLKVNVNYTLCTIMDTHFGKILQNLLTTFRVGIPLPLLLVSLFVLIIKYSNNRRVASTVDNNFTHKMYTAKSHVLFGIALIILYIVASCPRHISHLIHTLTHNFCSHKIDSFKVPPLENTVLSHNINVWLAILHYSSIVIRECFYIFLIPELKVLIYNNFKLISITK